MSEGKLILDDYTIKNKVKRVAYEIAEDNYDEKELILIGIWDRGYLIAERLAKLTGDILGINPRLFRLDIDKPNAQHSDIKLDAKPEDIKGKSVVVVDDVLNTGKTLMYALIPILKAHPRKLESAVLVNRSHKLFPVSATFTGLELATTFDEHIEVVFEDDARVILK